MWNRLLALWFWNLQEPLSEALVKIVPRAVGRTEERHWRNLGWGNHRGWGWCSRRRLRPGGKWSKSTSWTLEMWKNIHFWEICVICVIISVLCVQLKLEIQWSIDQKLALLIPELHALRISSDCLKICVHYVNGLLKYSILTFS